MSTSILLASLLLALGAAPRPAAGVRFAGLERLYFERVADLESRFTTDQTTGKRAPLPLPARLEPPVAAPEAVEDAPAEEDLMVTVDDFPLPTAEGEPALTLRQVVAWPESRVKEVYWALYEGGRRQDVWWYTPVHRRAEGKVLPNHRLYTVSRRDDGRFVLHGVGAWDPAGGSYFERGEELFFRLERGELRFELLLAPYGFFQSEPVVESAEDDLDYRLHYSAFVERLVAGPEGERIERRALDQASDELVARCAARGEDGEPCVECGEASDFARCLAESPQVVVTSRRPDEPSFVEVGGTATGWR